MGKRHATEAFSTDPLPPEMWSASDDGIRRMIMLNGIDPDVSVQEYLRQMRELPPPEFPDHIVRQLGPTARRLYELQHESGSMELGIVAFEREVR